MLIPLRLQAVAWRVLGDRRGVTAAEYAILAVGVTVAVGSAVVTLNDPVDGIFARLGVALLQGQASLGAGGR